MSDTTHKQGMEQPLHYWVPSIAPSGLSVYQGSQLSKWQGHFLLGSLKFGLLVRLQLANGKVVVEERLVNGRFGRIRAVYVYRGDIYLLTDDSNGKIIKLSKQS